VFLKVSADHRVSLEERNNFRAFKLVIEGTPDDLPSVRRALQSIADLPDAETAWVSEAALRRWPAVAKDAEWQQSLDMMIDKAKPHGWIDEVRRTIRAHVEWVV
jgi:hypothetical protein